MKIFDLEEDDLPRRVEILELEVERLSEMVTILMMKEKVS